MHSLAASLHLLSLLLLVCTLPHAVQATLASAERSTLVDLYDSTNGPYWKYNQNWLSGDPCSNQWSGVTCDSAGTHVTSMYVLYYSGIDVGQYTTVEFMMFVYGIIMYVMYMCENREMEGLLITDVIAIAVCVCVLYVCVYVVCVVGCGWV